MKNFLASNTHSNKHHWQTNKYSHLHTLHNFKHLHAQYAEQEIWETHQSLFTKKNGKKQQQFKVLILMEYNKRKKKRNQRKHKIMRKQYGSGKWKYNWIFFLFFSSSLTPISLSIGFYLCFEVLQGVLRNLFVVVGVWVKLLGEGAGWKQQGKLNFRYYFSILLCTIYRHLHTYLSKYWTCCQGKWGVTMNVCCQPTNKYKFTHSNTTTFGRRREIQV